NSVCHNDNDAIVLTNTENSVISYNTISFNKYQGMSLYAANYNFIFSNIFQKNDYENAIKLEKAQNVILERNTCNNNSPNDIAVLVYYSNRIYLFDNTFSDNGDGLIVET
ncbi:unnamed protein product, partial [marine sediment metagenome]